MGDIVIVVSVVGVFVYVVIVLDGEVACGVASVVDVVVVDDLIDVAGCWWYVCF